LERRFLAFDDSLTPCRFAVFCVDLLQIVRWSCSCVSSIYSWFWATLVHYVRVKVLLTQHLTNSNPYLDLDLMDCTKWTKVTRTNYCILLVCDNKYDLKPLHRQKLGVLTCRIPLAIILRNNAANLQYVSSMILLCNLVTKSIIALAFSIPLRCLQHH